MYVYMYVYVRHTCQTNEHRQLNDCTGKLIKYRILFGYTCSEPIPPSTNKCNHRFCRPLKEQRAEKYFVEIALIIFSVTRNVWHYDRAKKHVNGNAWQWFYLFQKNNGGSSTNFDSKVILIIIDIAFSPSPTLDFLKKSLTFLYWFLNYYRFHNNNNNNNDGWKNTPYVFNIIIIGYWIKEKNAKQTYCQRHCHRHRRR